MTLVALTLPLELRLGIRCQEANLHENRELTDADFDRFKQWGYRYRQELHREQNHDSLLQIGRDMHRWLDGSGRLLQRVLNWVEPPLVLEFSIDREPSEKAKLFLDAPWELLADEHGHWAWNNTFVYCPIRRLGRRDQPREPSPHKLCAVFMAAAPRAIGNLQFEAEEAAILAATRDSGLDLVVEESGSLPLLRACVAREAPVDVIHLSCHGRLDPHPCLLLEDEFGDPQPTDASELSRALAGHPPRLLFLSACETAKADLVLGSLAWSLVQSVTPAVLGWAGSVGDHEATQFAAFLYRRLCEAESLADAFSRARLDLVAGNPTQARLSDVRSRDWHLARLYLGSRGGGVLATGRQGHRHTHRSNAEKAFLNRPKAEVPVAGALEFVGRRRPLQSILREFWQPKHVGVFIHGLGRQGKSSLAARIADRLERRHYGIAVSHGRYEPAAILQVIKEAGLGTEVDQFIQTNLPRVQGNPALLEAILADLLSGPCRQLQQDADGKRVLRRPVLLIFDDFEQALDSQQDTGHHRLNGHCLESIRAVLRAFSRVDTESRLLFTSRQQFTLIDDGVDFAERVLDIPLPPMDTIESQKQAAARLLILSADARTGKRQHNADMPEIRARLKPIIETCRGNPGLQDRLFRMAALDLAACDRCLSQMQKYLATGQHPNEHAIRAFLENLALGSLIALLSETQRDLLRASTLFELPVPEPVLARFAREARISSEAADLARLTALGLWDAYEDEFHPGQRALAVNPLVRPLAGKLAEPEKKTLLHIIMRVLFSQRDGSTERSTK